MSTKIVFLIEQAMNEWHQTWNSSPEIIKASDTKGEGNISFLKIHASVSIFPRAAPKVPKAVIPNWEQIQEYHNFAYSVLWYLVQDQEGMCAYDNYDCEILITREDEG